MIPLSCGLHEARRRLAVCPACARGNAENEAALELVRDLPMNGNGIRATRGEFGVRYRASPEQRLAAVRAYVVDGESCESIARRYGCASQGVYGWIKEAGLAGARGAGLAAFERRAHVGTGRANVGKVGT